MYYFSKPLDSDRTLCVSPLTDRLLQSAGQEIGDVSGYFLFCQDRSEGMTGVQILARLESEEAAFALKTLLGM